MCHLFFILVPTELSKYCGIGKIGDSVRFSITSEVFSRKTLQLFLLPLPLETCILILNLKDFAFW